jgi:PIN domain nuclease of toxin-antitoxin system
MLLDTHIVLWWAANMRQLRGDIRAAIGVADEVYISAASVWEAELKRSRGRLSFPGIFADVLAKNGFYELPVTLQHVEATAALPLHHRDPFGRMLVAQAIAERCTLVTADRNLSRYDVSILDARP